MRALLVVVAALLFLALGGTQALLPPFYAARLAEGLQASMDGVGRVEARVGAFPAYRLLAGRVGSLDVDAYDLPVNGLHLETLSLRGRNVRVDVLRAIGGELEIREADSLTVEMAVTGEELNGYVRRELDPQGFLEIELHEGETPAGARVIGRAELLGHVIELAVDGTFVIREDGGVAFRPEHLTVEGATIPSSILETLARQYELVLDLSGLPIPVAVDEVRTGEGRLTISGEARL